MRWREPDSPRSSIPSERSDPHSIQSESDDKVRRCGSVTPPPGTNAAHGVHELDRAPVSATISPGV